MSRLAGVRSTSSTAIPAQHPSHSSGVDGGSTRLAEIRLTSATAPPAQHSFRCLSASLSRGVCGGLTRPAADFIAPYEQCLQNGLRARVSINHVAGHQELVFCFLPTTSLAAATSTSKRCCCRRHRHCCHCQVVSANVANRHHRNHRNQHLGQHHHHHHHRTHRAHP